MKTLAVCFFGGLLMSVILQYNGISDFETTAWVALMAALPFGIYLFSGGVYG